MSNIQVINNVMEVGKPALMNYLKRRKNVEATDENVYARHEKDFDLTQPEQLPLFGEYFEMVFQRSLILCMVQLP